jgi:hypothetical protein
MLLVGGLLSAAMGAYHFALPYQFDWAGAIKGIPASVRWALFALNFFFSFLLLTSGLLVLMVARSRRYASPPGAWLVAGAGAFWAVNLSYQLIIPMPLPPSMIVLRIGLLAFAALALLLHAVPLILIRAQGATAGQ